MSSPTDASAIVEVIPYADISSVRGQDARVLLRKFHAAVVKADEGGTAVTWVGSLSTKGQGPVLVDAINSAVKSHRDGAGA